MGTSTILKINVKKICDENGIDATVESCAFSEAMTYLGTTDLILTSPEWSEMLPPNDAKLVEIMNLIDTDEITPKLIEAVKESFPDELN